jgi:type I restriction enzyme S subunit
MFTLYSIPAYEAGEPERLTGSEIGSTKQALEAGDVLLSRIVPHIRRAWIVEPLNGEQTIGSSEWVVFRGSDVEPSYLRHFLLSEGFHRQLMCTVVGVGGSLLRARPELVAKIQIPLPARDEQRRIARVMDAADAVRANRQRARERLRELRAGAMNVMFGVDGSRSDWPSVELGALLDRLTSGSRGWARYYAERGSLFLRIQNVKTDELVLEDVAFVDPPRTSEATRTRADPGDVVLSITADLGRTAVVPDGLGNVYINQHLALLRSRALHPRFLSAALASPVGHRQLLRRNRQGVKAGLNFDDIRSVRLPKPPPSVQETFVRQLECIDEQEERMRRHLTHLDALFASLQSRAFAGEL